jgi:PEP-CTERM motif
MRTMRHLRMTLMVGSALCLLVAPASYAAPLIVNGGFEAGFSSWTIANSVGSDGTFFLQAGTTSPVNGLAVPAPPGGVFAAMTDAQGPGGHVLYQDFLAVAQSSVLSFDLFVGNRADRFAAPPTLDWTTPALNQQARVDILRAGADPFSVSPADVLATFYQTLPGAPLVSGYNTFSFDVSTLLAANAGQMLRLRFAEVDNLNIFQLGVDNVSLQEAVIPEPATLMLCATGLIGLAIRRGRRQA